MSKSVAKETAVAEGATQNLPGEIWGISYVAVGILVLVALVSHYINATNNILGLYLGSHLATGLIFLFGRIAVFVVPLAIVKIGVDTFRGRSINLRRAILWTVLTTEICVLLAIHTLPAMAHLERIGSNALGTIFTYLLYKIFGPHRFGPYFIFSFLLMLTVVIALEINLRALFATIGEWCRTRGQAIGLAWSALLQRMQKTASQVPEETSAPPQPVSRPRKVSRKTLAQGEGDQSAGTAPLLPAAGTSVAVAAAAETATATEPAPAAGIDQAQEEARRLYEEQLAAFRQKRREPITIITPETAPPQATAEDEEPADEPLAIPQEDPGLQQALLLSEIDNDIPPDVVQVKAPKKPSKPYVVPAIDILPDPPLVASQIDRTAIEGNSHILEKTLLNFGVEGKVVNVCPGPVVNRYEIELAPGIKISRVVNLHDDLSMAVGGKRIRIEAPIPGKAAVGIELPNDEMQMVHFKHMLVSDAYRKSKNKLPIIIGKSVSGMPFVTDIRKMPHLLIAGQTGAGKSVCINTIICSLLMTRKPDELRLILIDPKRVELAYYEGIPHLMAPVVTEPKEAVSALQWGVNEMMRRYKLLAKVLARNIDSFNEKIEQKSIAPGILSEDDNKVLPFIVIIVDELADLMMTASRDVESQIQRIAQLARAVGIHLIVATQRPSVDIITGPIKANLTSRIAFRTIQSTDSRTILGHVGAEKLLGKGDMLFLRNGAPDIERFHGAYLSEEDVETIVGEIKKQEFEIDRIESFRDSTGGDSDSPDGGDDDDGQDVLFEDAARLIVSIGQGSTSLLQRRLKLGYSRAGRLMDQLHAAGIVGPQEGSKMREVRIRPEELEPLLATLCR